MIDIQKALTRNERDGHIIAMYQAGMSLGEVGHEFFMSRPGILRVLERNGIERRDTYAPRIDWQHGQ